MKRTRAIALLLFLSCLISQSFAQTGNHKAYPLYKTIKKTTTLVVLEDDDCDYNEVMRKAIEDFWTFTPYKFITLADLQSFLPSEGHSILLRNNRSHTMPNGRMQKHNDISLFLCNKEAVKDYSGIDELASINLADIYADEDYLYKLPGLIRGMHDYLDFLDAGAFDKASLLEKLDKYNNAQSNKLRNLLLLVAEDEMPEGLNSTKDLKFLYKHDIRAVGKQTITNNINLPADNMAFLHIHAYTRRIEVISTKDGQILYSAPPNDRGKITEKDIKRISKKAS